MIADVHLDGFLAADSLKFLVLQNLKQLSLEPHVHVADFIQQDGSTVGNFEHAGLFLKGAGKRSPLVAEQARFPPVPRAERRSSL